MTWRTPQAAPHSRQGLPSTLQAAGVGDAVDGATEQGGRGRASCSTGAGKEEASMHRVLMGLALSLAATAAWAASPTTPQSFVKEAATSGMAEIELARVAVQKSSNPQVKQYAEMMINDHTAADSELKGIAKKEGVTVPSAPTPQQEAAAKALREKSGAAFDAAYAAQMVQDHQKAVHLFQQASQDQSLDADLRSFAEKTLPKLQHHLQEAQKLNDAVAQR
jgi:putative membrane protein